MGNELGGRPKEHEFFGNGVADYEKMAQVPLFNDGLDRLLEEAKKYRVVAMCSERDPLDCHRCLLVGRALVQRGALVSHILADGSTMSHKQIEDKLLDLAGRKPTDLFETSHDQLDAAYRARAHKVAFKEH